MEERIVLSTITWNNRASSTGGSWDNANDWVGGVVPGANDDAVIDLGTGTVTFNNSGAESVHSITTNSTTNLAITGGTLNVASTSTYGILTVAGGTLGGAGSFTVLSPSVWSSGTITGAASGEFYKGLTLGSSSGTTPSALVLAGGRSLINDTTVTTASGGPGVSFSVSGGSTITNMSGATFTFASNSSIVDGGGTPDGGSFINQGTLGTNGGTGVTSIGIPITNTGTLQTQTGTLSFGAGGTFSGASVLNVSSGAVLGFSGGTFSIASGASAAGAGGMVVNGATVALAGTDSLTGTTEIDSGELDINSSNTIGSLNLTGGTLGGTGALGVTGKTTWTGGTMTGSGSTEAKGGLALGFSAGTAASTLALAGGRSLINDAAATAAANGQGVTIGLSGGSTITNQSGATFTFLSNSSIVDNGGSPDGGTFTNQGTLGANGGTGTTTLAIPVTNSGTIQAQTGTLSIGTGSTFSSATALKASSGATLAFASGTFAIPSGASTTGAGKLLVTGATITYAGSYGLTGLTEIDSGEFDFNAAATLGSFLLNGGTLGGTGALAVTGATTWYSGTMTGSGSIEAKGGLTLGYPTGSTPSVLTLAGGRSLINDASATVGANGAGLTLNVSDGSTLTNKATGTITVLSNSSIANNGGSPSGGTFNNLGTFTVNGGTGTTSVAISATNSGTFNVLTGALDLTGAFTNFASSNSTLTGGTYNVTGYLDFANAKIVTDKAAITLTGTSSDIRDLTGVSAVNGVTTTVAVGNTLSLQGGRNLTVPSFSNSGTLTLGSGSVFTSNGSYLQYAGTTTLTSATLTSGTNVVTVSGGNLDGKGTINGNLTLSGGRIRPGGLNNAALLSVTGNYTQGSSGSLIIDIGGTNPGTSYDRLAVSGTASINGNLTTDLIKSYVPGPGLTFRPLTFASKTGDFSSETGLNLGVATLSPVYDATGLNLLDNVAPAIPTIAPTISSSGVSSFNLSATDDETASSALVFTITSLPSGTLTYNGSAVTVGETFTGSPVGLSYTSPSVIFGNFTDSFTFTVQDDGTPTGVVATSTGTVNLSLANSSSGTAQVFGTSGNDTILAAINNGNLQVTLNGTSISTSVPVSAITQLDISGLGGNDTIETDALPVNTTITGTGTDTLTLGGTSGNDAFTVNGNTIGFNGATITGPSPYTINGLAGNDTFSILSANTASTLNGGDGNDSFVFANGASLLTTLDGGTGTNTIDESAVTSAVTLNVDALTVTNLSNPFTNIQAVLAGTNSGNTVNGPAAASTYSIAGANAGNVGGLTFGGFGNIVGGSGGNSFVFGDAASLSGSLNAGTGSNTIDESAYTTAVAANPSASTITGVGTTYTNVQTLIGSTSAGGTITGPAAATTYNITGANSGTIGAVTFSNYSSLVAGAANDTFKYASGGSLSGSIDGGGGVNTIDESSVGTPVALNIATSTITGVGVGFSNIQTITPGSGANSLTGPTAASTYNITGSNAGNVGGYTFSKFGTLIGGPNNDVFKFTSSAVLSGGINGGGGSNTLDYSAFTTQVTLNLAASTVSRVASAFSNIQSVIAGSFNGNQIQGSNSSTIFNITGANSGTINTLAFSNFARIAGGTGNDTFKLSDGASLSASIDGGAGTNVIDESAYSTAVTANLTTSTITGIGLTFTNIRTITGGTASNSLTGPSANSTFSITGTNTGIVGTLTFSKFGTLIGGSGNDTFKFGSTAVITGTIDGGSGTNTFDYSAFTTQVTLNLAAGTSSRVANPYANIQTVIAGTFSGNQLIGPAASSTYNITGANAGNVNGTTFSNFGRITGGAAADTFVFSDAASLSNGLDGGGGSNILDESAYSTPVSLNLAASTITGIGTTFANIKSITGGTASNTLTGPAAATTFSVTGTNTGAAGTTTFAKFGTLIGGAGNDTFKMGTSAVLSGAINGGAGTNTFDYSAFTTQVTLNLATSTISRVTGAFSNIQSVIAGNNAGNYIQGPAADTTYNITATNAGNVNGLSFSSFGKIVGGAGDDTFVLSDGAGLSNKVDGGTGVNWLDYSAYSTGVTVNLSSGAATGFGSTISNINNVKGGSGNDTLTGGSAGNVLIGGPGNDTLNGGSGRSILIGGTGADTINGGSNDDIVIGGTTTDDSSFEVLDSILAEWASSDSYATRVNLIKNGGGQNGTNTLVSGTSVLDDSAVDALHGNAGTDWFFIGTGDTADNQPGEQVN